ncbi:unnamed protein product [Auanema sp. JU1783]|nr:unnamed protein product [Auanema sp. JU1783]
MKFLVFILISCIQCHLIIPFSDVAHDTSTQASKAERVFVPHPLNDSLGHNVTKAFWDRYRQTSFIMMQILSFHQLFYSFDGTLTAAAASTLLQNIHFEKFQYMNYTQAEIKGCVYESFYLLPPNIQRKIIRFLKSVRDKYVNNLKEPRIAAKAKKVLKAFRTGEIFTYNDSLLSLSVKNMSANEEWEASVFDPVRLVYLEYSTIAETNGKMVIDPLPYIRRFETFHNTIVPDERYQKTNESGTEVEGSGTAEPEVNGTEYTFHPRSFSTASTLRHSTVEPSQAHSHQTQYSTQTTSFGPIAQTAQTFQINTQTDQVAHSHSTVHTVQNATTLIADPSSQTTKAEGTEQPTTTASVPVYQDIFSFSFLQHKSDNNLTAHNNISVPESTPSDRFTFMSDRTTVGVANATESTPVGIGNVTESTKVGTDNATESTPVVIGNVTESTKVGTDNATGSTTVGIVNATGMTTAGAVNVTESTTVGEGNVTGSRQSDLAICPEGIPILSEMSKMFFSSE